MCSHEEGIMAIEQIPIDQNVVTVTSLAKLDVYNNSQLNSTINKSEAEQELGEKQDTLSVAAQAQLLRESQKAEQQAEQLAEQRALLTPDAERQEKEEVEQVLEVINQLIPLKNTNLIFEFDDISDPPIVKVVDKNTDEVIREIPPKRIREIAQAFNDMADSISKTGALFNSEV